MSAISSTHKLDAAVAEGRSMSAHTNRLTNIRGKFLSLIHHSLLEEVQITFLTIARKFVINIRHGFTLCFLHSTFDSSQHCTRILSCGSSIGSKANRLGVCFTKRHRLMGRGRRYFLGCRSIEVDVPPGDSLNTLKHRRLARHPGLEHHLRLVGAASRMDVWRTGCRRSAWRFW